ncbi:zf-TFIIB domain-containing protein [Glycomyces tarimensis]
MQQYERNGVVVEQCTGCRGIFLDRGELDHLLDAEAAFNARMAPARSAPAPVYDDRRYDDRRYDDRRHYGDRDRHYKKRKRKSVFEELFDF